MRNKIIITLSLLLSLPALAKDLSITIEHAQVNYMKAFKKEVNCNVKCSDLHRKNIQAVFDLVKAGKVPSNIGVTIDDKYVDVIVSDGKESHSVSLATSEIYTGEDLKKFTKINNLIQKIEFNLAQEKAGK